MTFDKRDSLVCLLVLCLSITLGCGKKGGEPVAPSTPPAQPQAPAQAPSVDTAKPIPEVQAQAETMSVDALKATALKYKDAIVAKQADLDKVLAKIKEIPITDALGPEAKALKTDVVNLQTSLKALKDRFQVYYDTLKKKGGDTSGLSS